MKIEDVIEKFRNNGTEQKYRFGSSASDNLVKEAEEIFGGKLTEDINYFYKNINGIESNDDYCFRIVPLNEVIDFYLDNENHGFVFAEYLIYCDLWELEISGTENKIISYVPDKENKEILYRVTWSENFTEFLNLYFERGLEGLIDRASELSLNPDYSEKTYQETEIKNKPKSIDSKNKKAKKIINKFLDLILGKFKKSRV